MHTPANARGARTAGDGGDGRKKKKGLILLLALLGLLLLGLIALLSLTGDDDKDAKRSQSTTSTPAGTQGATGGAAAPEAQPGSKAGQLTAGGTTLLPGPGGKELKAVVGQDAEGTAVVRRVTESGYFVGTSAQDELYVEYGGEAGGDERDADQQGIKEGDQVRITGPVKASPSKTADVLDLEPADAKVVEQQGAYVNADEFEPAA